MAVSRPVRLRGCLLGVLSFINSMRSIPLKGQQRSKDERPKTFAPELYGNACYAGYFIKVVEFCFPVFAFTVADPDLLIKRGGGWRGGGRGLQKISFQPFGPQFGLKIRGEAGFPGPLPWNHHWFITVVSLAARFIWLF